MEPLCKQSSSQHKQHLSVVLGWSLPNPLHQASVSPSLSVSSSIVSDRGSLTLSESSGHTTSSLKEHDYIGLAEVFSAPSFEHADTNIDLNFAGTSEHADSSVVINLAETDLRLGLGPPSILPKPLPQSGVPDFMNNDISVESPWLQNVASLPRGQSLNVSIHSHDDAKMPPSVPSAWQCPPSRNAEAMTISHIGGFHGSATAVASKNGSKRMYSETVMDVGRDVRGAISMNSMASGTISTGDLRPCVNLPPGQPMSIQQFHDADVKSHSSHAQNLYWGAMKLPLQQHQVDRANLYAPVVSQKALVFSTASPDKQSDARNSKSDLTFPNDGPRNHNQGNSTDETPPAKGQVVGWPPVRSYRKSTLATRSRLAREDGDGQSAIYVKVNMDGIPIGRKVDLNAHSTYEGLLSVLEEMFHNPSNGHQIRSLKGSDFVLTYEDKEGDWMLVGDVPWGMFVNTVRRLRISRGSEVTGLGN